MSASSQGLKVGDIVEAQVTKIHSFGAVVRIGGNLSGLIHISQVCDEFVKDINDHLKVGDKVKTRIKKIGADGKIDLTLKQEKTVEPVSPAKNAFRLSVFQDKMDEFLKKNKSAGGQ